MSKRRFPEVYDIVKPAARKYKPLNVYTEKRVGWTRIKFWCYPVDALAVLTRVASALNKSGYITTVDPWVRHGAMRGYNLVIRIND